MWITFTERHKVQQGDGNGPLYEQGKSYEFKGFVAETYARKYIARGYAVEGKPEPKVEPKPVKVDVPAPQLGSAADVPPQIIPETSAPKPNAYRRK